MVAREENCWRESLINGEFATSDICQKYEFIGHAAPFYRELDTTYRRAKFILLCRDEFSWFKSAKRQLVKTRDRARTARMGVFDTYAILRLLCFGSVDANRQTLHAKYWEYYSNVRRYFFDKYGEQWDRRVLMMDITAGDGWDTLCHFLGQPVPDEPFPNLPYARKLNDLYRATHRAVWK
jgi:hypothetical protein